MATPQRSRYPRPLRATHVLGAGNVSNNGSGSPSQGAGRRFPSSPSSPGAAGGGRRAWLPTSPDSPSGPGGLSGERVLVPLSGGRGEEEEEREAESRRRANSLTSLADPSCCYGNSLWQRGPQLDLPLAPEGEGVGDEAGTTEDEKEPAFHLFSHKRSNSCSSADSLKKTQPVPAGRGREDAHTRKSIEGLNQEVSSVLEGVLIISPHQPPDGHMAPIKDLLRSGRPHSSPQFAIWFSPSSLPSSPLPHSTPSPSALATPTDLPDTPTGFALNSPSLSNPSFARDPPDGIERCLTAEIKPLSSAEIIPIGPDKTKAKIVFQKSSAFLPTALAINSVS